MNEILLLMVLLFAVYLFLPETWHAKFALKAKSELTGQSDENALILPEDSVLRRHYITQLRAEIEQGLFPRPTDFTLQRHYDALVEAELESRLSALATLAA
ncbi:hypothetical protein [Methylomonas sp. AM2-LC]|uniref:hypothetical protein n=1 Tax=Methylomonas sp. AM2-LC TaxID=3153301 RepID=UPI003267D040